MATPGLAGQGPPPAADAGLDESMGALVGVSLLTWAKGSRAVLMHRLAARVVREREQAAGRLDATVADLAQRLSQAAPPERHAWDHREDGEELVAHVQELWQLTVTRSGTSSALSALVETLAGLAGWAVRHLTATADLTRAIAVGGQVVTDCARVLGAHHLATLTARNNLAGAYESVGDLTRAIALYEATVTDCKRTRGADHPATLTAQNNLAAALLSARHLTQAMPIFEAILTARAMRAR
jgi:hypothetical protein